MHRYNDETEPPGVRRGNWWFYFLEYSNIYLQNRDKSLMSQNDDYGQIEVIEGSGMFQHVLACTGMF
jgi:hypothetical protein